MNVIGLTQGGKLIGAFDDRVEQLGLNKIFDLSDLLGSFLGFNVRRSLRSLVVIVEVIFLQAGRLKHW